MNAEFGETTPAQETIPDLESKDAQLYAVLQTLCEKEAFTLVRSAGKSKGLEAWRRLCKRFRSFDWRSSEGTASFGVESEPLQQS